MIDPPNHYLRIRKEAPASGCATHEPEILEEIPSALEVSSQRWCRI
jgi:hypothetical protein